MMHRGIGGPYLGAHTDGNIPVVVAPRLWLPRSEQKRVS